MKKYIIYPGHITSRIDGDPHFISAEQLMVLYGVSISECVIIENKEDTYKLNHFRRNLIPLFPRENGLYEKQR